MATIHATCPTCGQVMEVGSEKAGTKIECSECLQVFAVKGQGGKVTGAPTKSTPAAKPARKRRRDGDDDDDYAHDHIEEYDDDDYEPPRRRGGHSGLRPASGVLILGIVSIVFACFPILGVPIAIVTVLGPSSAQYPPGEAGLVRIGKTLAWITIGLLLVLVAIYWMFRRG